jgi:long-chain acyl-CoA synthetase|tara:strand:- start:625 stop:2193 length:1569 start_codon:yes stop_codon:yes gene_type:complete
MKELIYARLYLPAIQKYGENTGIIDGSYQSDWDTHHDRVLRLCDCLSSELDVSKTDRFAVMALNSHQFLELWHAAFLGAGVMNPLNLRLAPKELAYILKDSGTEVIFTDQFFAPLITAAREELGDEDPIRHVVLIGEGDVQHDLKYEELLGTASPALPEEPEEDDAVVLMYTGGTTGLPKGVLITQRAQVLNLYHGLIALGGFEVSSYLMQTPMFHAASMTGVLAPPYSGGSVVFIPMFDPEGAMALMEAHKVEQTLMVPTMIGMCLAAEGYDPSRLKSLKQLIYGASPMPRQILEKLFTDLPDLELVQGYGMTESSSTLTILGADDHFLESEKLSSVGKPVIGTVVSIQDEEGNELPQGEIGEVCARGGNFMTEYWNKAEATEEVFANGWYHTGDAGYFDEDGYLFLVDRVKDMIVTGGENVYSSEVENAISSHPDVAQVAAIGIPDDKWGEAVHAIVVLEAGGSASEEDLIEHARGSIAGYKVPKSIDFREEPLPLSGAMKVLKRELRAPYWEGKERGIN